MKESYAFERDLKYSVKYSPHYNLLSGLATWYNHNQCVANFTRETTEEIPLAIRDIIAEFSRDLIHQDCERAAFLHLSYSIDYATCFGDREFVTKMTSRSYLAFFYAGGALLTDKAFVKDLMENVDPRVWWFRRGSLKGDSELLSLY